MNDKKITTNRLRVDGIINEMLLDLENHMQIYLEALRKISLSEGSKTTMKRIANQALSAHTKNDRERKKDKMQEDEKLVEHDRKRLVQLKKFWDAINE